jgi:threonine dehydratase
VKSEAAPAAYLSWKSKELREATMQTFAEGLATRVGFGPQRTLWQLLDTFVLVTDEEIRRAVLEMIKGTRNLAEPAGAAPLAAAIKLRNRLAGKRVALICSGGNISLPQLGELITGATARTLNTNRSVEPESPTEHRLGSTRLATDRVATVPRRPTPAHPCARLRARSSLPT